MCYDLQIYKLPLFWMCEITSGTVVLSLVMLFNCVIPLCATDFGKPYIMISSPNAAHGLR